VHPADNGSAAFDSAALIPLPGLGASMHVRERAAAVPSEGAAAPSKPTILLFSASPGDSRDYAAVVPLLSLHGHRCIAADWPGFGRSPPLPGDAATPPAFLAAARELLTQLALPGPVVLIGNSVGGFVAARLAAESPARVAALVLVSPGGFTPHSCLTRLFCRSIMGSPALAPSSALFARVYLSCRTPTVAAMLARADGEHAAPGAREIIRSMWRAFPEPENDLRAGAVAGVACPTLLVFGALDPVISHRTDGREARRALPRALFKVLSTGHSPFAEAPGEFMAALAPFLDAL
jgi:pimeloyl-ACP methyl ester carboxylesterase